VVSITRASIYHTKQGEAVQAFVAKAHGRDITAEDIAAHLSQAGVEIGLTTIYRHLDKLEKSGLVRKIVIDGKSSACYRYVGEDDGSNLHMKCDSCGRLYTLECHEADQLGQHILTSHQFQVDPIKTVFYGKCAACQDPPGQA